MDFSLPANDIFLSTLLRFAVPVNQSTRPGALGWRDSLLLLALLYLPAGLFRVLAIWRGMKVARSVASASVL